MVVLQAILGVFFGYCAVLVGYYLLFSVAGRLRRPVGPPPPGGRRHRIAVMIAAYKEDAVIVEVAEAALRQSYPRGNYDVIVIADSLQAETLERLRAMPLMVHEVSFEVSTKSKALNATMAWLPENKYDAALILDADNIMAFDFVEKIDRELNKGFWVVQGHRTAKNTDTNIAILDAVSEEINNHIFRKGHRALGLSSALIGSGMAFKYDYFKATMAKVNAVGGFDKELELRILRDGHRMQYIEEAYVYDEKVQNIERLGNQRRRWIAAQVHYFREYFLDGVWHLLTRGNIDYFNKAFQMAHLPRVLLLGVLVLMNALAGLLWVLGYQLYPGNAWWFGLFGGLFVALLLAVPPKLWNAQTYAAVARLPQVFWVMLLTLFKLKGANKRYIHTPHGPTTAAAGTGPAGH